MKQNVDMVLILTLSLPDIRHVIKDFIYLWNPQWPSL